MSYPNQKTIFFNEENLLIDGKNINIYNNLLFSTMKSLNNTEFKVWLFFYMNASSDFFFLTAADVCAAMGLSTSTYFHALRELANKGFLVEEGSKVAFYAIPIEPKPQTNLRNAAIVEGNRVLPTENGVSYMSIKEPLILSAANDLSYSGFRLWLYLCSFSQDEYLEMTNKKVCSETGIGAKQYYEAVQELIDKNFLHKEGNKIYRFYREGK